ICLCIFGFTVFEAKAGFFFDAALGLRLPAEVKVNSPSTIEAGKDYNFTTSLTPLDFDAADYSALGIPPEDGNELVAHFILFFGVKLVILNIVVNDDFIESNIDVPKLCQELEGKDCGNFVTPFGFDADGNPLSFPIPALKNISPDKTGLKYDFLGASLGIGLSFVPLLSSGKITTEWKAINPASGSGAITYS